MVDEAEMYRTAGFDLVYSAENVKIEAGYDTTSRIRDGLSVSTYEEAIEQWKTESAAEDSRLLSGRTNKSRKRSEDEEPFMHMKSGHVSARNEESIFAASPSPVVSRSHTRLLLEQSGLAVKYFADLVEFIQVLLDCVQGEFSLLCR